jgi:hypothetical protein
MAQLVKSDSSPLASPEAPWYLIGSLVHTYRTPPRTTGGSCDIGINSLTYMSSVKGQYNKHAAVRMPYKHVRRPRFASLLFRSSCMKASILLPSCLTCLTLCTLMYVHAEKEAPVSSSAVICCKSKPCSCSPHSQRSASISQPLTHPLTHSTIRQTCSKSSQTSILIEQSSGRQTPSTGHVGSPISTPGKAQDPG